MISHLFSHLSQFIDMHFCVTDSASLTLRHWLCVADSASLTLRHWRVAEFVTFLLGIRRRKRIRRRLRRRIVADSRRSRTAPMTIMFEIYVQWQKFVEDENNQDYKTTLECLIAGGGPFIFLPFFSPKTLLLWPPLFRFWQFWKILKYDI